MRVGRETLPPHFVQTGCLPAHLVRGLCSVVVTVCLPVVDESVDEAQYEDPGQDDECDYDSDEEPVSDHVAYLQQPTTAKANSAQITSDQSRTTKHPS